MARSYGCASLISEGLILAGDTSLTERAIVWMNNWLRSQYAAWPWPFLQKRASSLSLPAGTGSMDVGAGSGGVTDDILRILDPIFLYTSDKKTRGVVRVSKLVGGDIDSDEDARESTRTGRPQTVKVRPSSTTNHKFKLIFDPISDVAYNFSFDYLFMPEDVATGTTGGSAIPMYPSDQTLIQMIKTRALEHMTDDRADAENEKLRGMAVDDRIKFGQTTGVNELWDMNGKTFKGQF